MLQRRAGIAEMRNVDQSVSARRQTAAEMMAVELSRLARMADANRFDLLAYLIDMAVLEAWREANGESAPVELGSP